MEEEQWLQLESMRGYHRRSPRLREGTNQLLSDEGSIVTCAKIVFVLARGQRDG